MAKLLLLVDSLEVVFHISLTTRFVPAARYWVTAISHQQMLIVMGGHDRGKTLSYIFDSTNG